MGLTGAHLHPTWGKGLGSSKSLALDTGDSITKINTHEAFLPTESPACCKGTYLSPAVPGCPMYPKESKD
jgi:hypothetical protein